MQSKSDWLYLGIPLDESYPHTKFHLDNRVPQEKYWGVSQVSHVTKNGYEADLAAGHMLFQEQHAGTQFYATESRVHLPQNNGVWYWVTILERKAYP